MAYDASNTGNQQQQVASSTPLSQGGQTAPTQQPTDSGASAPSQPATIQAGANTAQQAAGQAQPSQNKQPKASSGMFTNIQKYAQANQPQAANMAKAAGSVLEKQASNVGEQVAKQQQAQQNQVTQYNARMEAAKNFANQQIQAANQGQELSETDVGRFRNLATGNEGFGQIQSMNLSPQQAEAARLQQQAGRSASDEGRRELLKQRFAQGGQQYTQGQQGLDALIVGSDQGARQALAQQAQGAAKQAQGGIQGALQEQAAALQGAEQGAQDFRTGLQEQTTGASKQVITDLDAQVAAEQAARKAQLDELTGLQTGTQERLQALQNQLNMGTAEGRQQLLSDLFTGMTNVGRNQYGISNMADIDKQIERLKQLNTGVSGSGEINQLQNLKDYISTGDAAKLKGIQFTGGKNAEARLNAAIGNTALGKLSQQDLALLGMSDTGKFGGIDPNTLGVYNRATFNVSDLVNKISDIGSRAKSFDYNKLLAKELEGVQGGLSLDDLRSGADIRRESLASPEQMARYSALSKLAGTQGTDLMKENTRDRLTQDEMTQLLSKLRTK
jgi:hypothetical protein